MNGDGRTWPINWGFGGIAWANDTGFRSLYVVLRFGSDTRRAFGFILRWMPKPYT